MVANRRSAFVFEAGSHLHVETLPMVYGASEDWYIKPDAGLLLGSPANVDPVPPQDVQPEVLDIAMAIHRIGEMTTLEIKRPIRTWAALRGFRWQSRIVDEGLSRAMCLVAVCVAGLR